MSFTVIPLVVATLPLPPVALPIDWAMYLTSSRGAALHHKIDLPEGTGPLLPTAAATTAACDVWRAWREVEEEKQCPRACLS
jgi:hypothetical protein